LQKKSQRLQYIVQKKSQHSHLDLGLHIYERVACCTNESRFITLCLQMHTSSMFVYCYLLWFIFTSLTLFNTNRTSVWQHIVDIKRAMPCSCQYYIKNSTTFLLTYRPTKAIVNRLEHMLWTGRISFFSNFFSDINILKTHSGGSWICSAFSFKI